MTMESFVSDVATDVRISADKRGEAAV